MSEDQIMGMIFGIAGVLCTLALLLIIIKDD